jgi:hypothetical protein
MYVNYGRVCPTFECADGVRSLARQSRGLGALNFWLLQLVDAAWGWRCAEWGCLNSLVCSLELSVSEDWSDRPRFA